MILAVREAIGENIFLWVWRTTLEELARGKSNNRERGAAIFNQLTPQYFLSFFAKNAVKRNFVYFLKKL